MSDLSTRLALPLIAPSQAQKHVTHNEALQQLDLLVQMRVEGFDDTVPPPAPIPGALHGLGVGAQGAWAGQDGQLAAFLDESWLFLTPQDGWLALQPDTGELRIYREGTWQIAPERLDRLGIGTSADAVNRLALASDATLFSHAGSDHHLKINKAAATDTASLLFQSDWTGHAEMGLAGINDFTIKVSPDGTAWTEALTLDQNTGRAGGAAVQANALDTTAGRLLQVGAFGLGLGESQNPAVTPDMDATDLISGATLRGEGNTLNRPSGRNGSGVVWRGSGTSGLGKGEQHQLYGARLGPDDTPTLYYRSLDTDGVWADWAALFHTGNLVGAVDQSGGTPTGAVIERGSNANGEYVRFADGTQICWRHCPTQTTSVIVGSVATSTGELLAFPAAFTAPPKLSISVIRETGSIAHWAGSVTATATQFNWRLLTAANGASGSATLSAIGRWF